MSQDGQHKTISTIPLKRGRVLVQKKADDPLAVRVSIGGEKTMGDNYYCTYRGTREEALRAVQAVFVALSQQDARNEPEPEITPDQGKQFA